MLGPSAHSGFLDDGGAEMQLQFRYQVRRDLGDGAVVAEGVEAARDGALTRSLDS